MSRSARIFAWVVLTAGAASLGYAGGVSLEMSRHVIAGGGVMHTAAGELELSGTVGQPDAGGAMSGGSFELRGGFWFEIPPGDCNEDGAADVIDMPDFAACLEGPGGAAAAGPCRCFDLNGSQHVDLADFATVQAIFHGR